MDYKKWYADNKERISQKRKSRYHSDPLYRDKVLKQSRTSRQSKLVKLQPGLSAQEVAEALEISTWLLHNWTKREWLPKAKRQGRVLRYTEQQVGLVKMLADFMKDRGPRMSAEQKEQHQTLVQSIAANWNIEE